MKRKELIEKGMEKYENELNEYTDKELKNYYISWFEGFYDIEELEKVKRNEMIFDLLEDKRRYVIYYDRDELMDFLEI
ncbi:MAG: hypothetical protein GOVbin1678_43 [Prokaryotic dsDNA virus sp.]|nr:MAG: hypothetical protein GOVbin1678_43 [Prokaryotic dsDNA virus sp.]|tara:strand:+ start:22521 stop:22754 length:234 start_codon:yes stop_codon:yes gene_type:complete